MKLSYKIFIAFLITSFLIVALLVGIMQFFVYRNFDAFINQTELEKLDNLVLALAEEYRTNNGWNPIHFKQILDRTLPVTNNKKKHPPPHVSVPFSMTEGPNPHHGRRPGHRPPPHPDPLSVDIRLCLFDINKNHVVGPFEPDNEFIFRAILLNNKTIGWLGLKIVDRKHHPLEVSFLKAQKKAFYLMGTGIFILAVCISFLLSRHLLSPIQALMKGTKAMSSFDFDTEINVNSKDELGKLADDFNHMAKTLKHYEAIRKNWVSDISHELRTPISIIKGKIEALQDGIRKVTPETLDSLHNDIMRLEKLVEDLHLLSLADSENILIRKKKVTPLQILIKTLEGFQIRLNKQSIDLKSDLSDNTDITIFANRERLVRLFSNLIENTLRYTDSPGNLTITHKINHTFLTLCFEDSSPGVSEENLGLIFNRLYRVDRSRSRAFGGSGLGLSICKQIVENHQGTIEPGPSKLGGLKILIQLPITMDH